MSLRTETRRAYRRLYRAAQLAAHQSDIANKEGFVSYVSHRFQNECENNRLRLTSVIEHNFADDIKFSSRKQAVQYRNQMIHQYQRYLSQKIDNTRSIANTLYLAPENESLVSVLQVLGAGIGNVTYQQRMEENFMALASHDEVREKRQENTEEEESERQNRIMQQAVLPFAEKLLLAHRSALTPPSSAYGRGGAQSGVTYLTPWQMAEAMVGSRVGVTAHHLNLGLDQAVVEIDETYNKQTIYVVCRRTTPSHDAVTEGNAGEGEECTTDSFVWEEDVERVEISESDEVSRTVFVSNYLNRAFRLCDALENETPIHRSRKTVVIGHSVGGAVGVSLSLLLLHRGYNINNVITFGSPKSLQETQERLIAGINPIRVVLSGDPLVDVPVSGAEGKPCVHIGEILLLEPQVQPDQTSEAFHHASEDSEKSDEIEKNSTADWAKHRYRHQFLVEHYVRHLSDPEVPLTYAEGDDVWDAGDYDAMKTNH